MGDGWADLRKRLGSRRQEIEEEILARVYAGAEDRGYPDALRKAVAAGVNQGLVVVEQGGKTSSPIPGPMFIHARHAARGGVMPDAMLRGYFAGYTTFCDFVVKGALDGRSFRGIDLGRALSSIAILFERFVIASMAEYTRERGRRQGLRNRRQLEHVRRLLGGASVDAVELAYEFDDWHIGAVARGRNAASALRDFSRVLDRRLLLVRPDRDTVWAWLAGRHRLDIADIAPRASLEPEDGFIALGEPARGIQGWRLTHEQALAAFRISPRGVEGIVQYANVGLLASIAQDDVLTTSLHQLYLAPLMGGRDDGMALRDTLRAYFTAGRNVSSAASALRVSRQTVSNRLRAIEEKLGRTLESCTLEVELALRLEDRGNFVDFTQMGSGV